VGTREDAEPRREREIPHGKCNKDIRIGENSNWKEAILYVVQ